MAVPTAQASPGDASRCVIRPGAHPRQRRAGAVDSAETSSENREPVGSRLLLAPEDGEVHRRTNETLGFMLAVRLCGESGSRSAFSLLSSI
jgi:hypothetical protein